MPKKPKAPEDVGFKLPLFNKTYNVRKAMQKAFNADDAHLAIKYTYQHEVLMQVISESGLTDSFNSWLGAVEDMEAADA